MGEGHSPTPAELGLPTGPSASTPAEAPQVAATPAHAAEAHHPGGLSGILNRLMGRAEKSDSASSAMAKVAAGAGEIGAANDARRAEAASQGMDTNTNVLGRDNNPVDPLSTRIADKASDAMHSTTAKVASAGLVGLTGMGAMAAPAFGETVPVSPDAAHVQTVDQAPSTIDLNNPAVTVSASGGIELGASGANFGSDNPSGEMNQNPQPEIAASAASSDSLATPATGDVGISARSETVGPNGERIVTTDARTEQHVSSISVDGVEKPVEEAPIATEIKGVLKQAIDVMKLNPQLKGDVVVVQDADGSIGVFTKEGHQITVGVDGIAVVSPDAVQKAGFMDAVSATMNESSSWTSKSESTTYAPPGEQGKIETQTPAQYQGGIFEVTLPSGETLKACGIENPALVAESVSYTIYDAQGNTVGTYGSLEEAPASAYSAGGKIETHLTPKAGEACDQIARSTVTAIHSKQNAGPGFDQSPQDLVTSGGVSRVEAGADGRNTYVSSVVIPEKPLLGADGKPVCGLNIQVDSIVGPSIAKLGLDSDQNGTPDWYKFNQEYKDVRLISAGEGQIAFVCTPKEIPPKHNVTENSGSDQWSAPFIIIKVAPPTDTPTNELPRTGTDTKKVAAAGAAAILGGIGIAGAGRALGREQRGLADFGKPVEAGAGPTPDTEATSNPQDILHLQSEQPKITVSQENVTTNNGRTTATEVVNKLNVNEGPANNEAVRAKFAEALARVGKDLHSATEQEVVPAAELSTEPGIAEQRKISREITDELAESPELNPEQAELTQQINELARDLNAMEDQIVEAKGRFAKMKAKVARLFASGKEGSLKGKMDYRDSLNKAGESTPATTSAENKPEDPFKLAA
ncbi:hypothetical protein HYS00_04180 [Candidatus Microgenomates bacterium]|nr:hypothetical protein [Candidatus Microgenomates bacterium]